MVISIRARHLKGFAKTKGLIGKKILPVYFTTRFGIHTFFLKEPIDVLILNSRGVVRIVRKTLYPNSIFFWPPTFGTVVELPQGTVRRMKIREGTSIRLITR